MRQRICLHIVQPVSPAGAVATNKEEIVFLRLVGVGNAQPVVGEMSLDALAQLPFLLIEKVAHGIFVARAVNAQQLLSAP